MDEDDDARRPEPVEIGVVAAEGGPRGLAESVAEDLVAELEHRFEGMPWRVVVRSADAADPTADTPDLVDALRRRLLDEGWEIAIGLTDLPLRAGRRPVVAHASAAHGVGLISVPALGALRREQRLVRAVVHLVEGLVGEHAGAADDRRDPQRARRMAARLRELAAPVHAADAEDGSSVRFVSAVVRGNLRLLVGMVRANEPWRVAIRLSRALVGALGVGAVSLASQNIWQLADGLSIWRLLAAAVTSLVVTCVALVLAHGLWERPRGPEARERIVLFNVVTCVTLALGVLCFYAGLFAVVGLAAAVIIPPHVLAQNLHHGAGLVDYLELTWFVTSIAMIGGALGSLVESDEAVRDAAYRPLADARTEADADADALGADEAPAGAGARRDD